MRLVRGGSHTSNCSRQACPIHCCFLLILLSNSRLFCGLQVGVQLLLLYMLYFFTGMALRESVLKVGMRNPSFRGASAPLWPIAKTAGLTARVEDQNCRMYTVGACAQVACS